MAQVKEKIHQSTPEEIEAARERVKAAECKGDGVHSTDLRFWHDWRLWRRDMRYRDDGTLGWPQDGWTEQWYCTRCRIFEVRTILLEEDA